MGPWYKSDNFGERDRGWTVGSSLQVEVARRLAQQAHRLIHLAHKTVCQVEYVSALDSLGTCGALESLMALRSALHLVCSGAQPTPGWFAAPPYTWLVRGSALQLVLRVEGLPRHTSSSVALDAAVRVGPPYTWLVHGSTHLICSWANPTSGLSVGPPYTWFVRGYPVGVLQSPCIWLGRAPTPLH